MPQPWTPLTDDERAALRSIAPKIQRPELGVPDELFAFAVRVVGMTNVDLLTFDDQGRVLLAWREDEYASGWHVPGGIIRGAESIERRIAETAREELGGPVDAEPAPSAILQFRGQRGSFISLVFRCRLGTPLSRDVRAELDHGRPGELAWFAEMPPRTYPSHFLYRELAPLLRRGDAAAAPLMRTATFADGAGWTRPGDGDAPDRLA